jgi:hypothetical protein
MKHFTIDEDNNITVHASRKAARDTGAGVFGSEEQFADLIGPDSKRLVEIWNSLPGVKPATKFANRKVATERIWKAIQELGGPAAAQPGPEPTDGTLETDTARAEVLTAKPKGELMESEPTLDVSASHSSGESALPVEDRTGAPSAEPIATVGAQAPDVTPPAAKASKKATRSKKAPRPAAKAKDTRAGSKTATILELLKRPGGASRRKSWRLRLGKRIRSAASYRAHSARRWA